MGLFVCLCGLTVWFQQEQACSTDFAAKGSQRQATTCAAGHAMSYGSACMHHMENTFACLAGGEAGDGVGSGRTAEGRWRQTCISISRAPCRELAAACTTHELSMHSPGRTSQCSLWRPRCQQMPWSRWGTPPGPSSTWDSSTRWGKRARRWSQGGSTVQQGKARRRRGRRRRRRLTRCRRGTAARGGRGRGGHHRWS